MALAELEFINRSEVVHFLGPPGTGNSHLALALGVQAVKAGRSVYFTPLSDLISALAKAEREGTLREKIRFFCRFSLLIVDEIGYLPTPSSSRSKAQATASVSTPILFPRASARILWSNRRPRTRRSSAAVDRRKTEALITQTADRHPAK